MHRPREICNYIKRSRKRWNDWMEDNDKINENGRGGVLEDSGFLAEEPFHGVVAFKEIKAVIIGGPPMRDGLGQGASNPI
ncbi:grfa protein [Moniliophthora roreri]|nr:grfa protein [Moniliophthora roreri]